MQTDGEIRSGTGRARLRRAFALVLALCCAAAAAAAPPADGPTPAAITFGILPIGGPSESRDAWHPVLEDMARAIDRPVDSFSVSSYRGIDEAMQRRQIDVAFLSGRLALDAVVHDRMQVVGQLTRGDGSKGYYAVLLVRRDSPIRSLDDVLDHPGRWRYARGETMSVSGYLVPETQIFAGRGLDSDTFFRIVQVDNHQNNALAVANGEVDVATNNTADLERFRARFPAQYAELREIWRSPLIPHAVLVVRENLPEPLKQRIIDFLTHYGSGADTEREIANLHRIHDIRGFAPADNQALVPFADITYTLERRQAMSSRWVSDAAREARLRRIEADHAALLRKLEKP